jgi:putative membrane protein
VILFLILFLKIKDFFKNNTMKHSFVMHFLKGAAMGTANVIPGVSGGTIALITGVFERLIHAIKHFLTVESLKILISGNLRAWAKHTDFTFLFALGFGVLLAIISVARILEFLFENYPVYVWAFFFGLIIASVYFVGRTVSKWSIPVLSFFILGTIIALLIALLKPATENAGLIYLIICGIVTACSMILPGLSGSFVLILMGNYELIIKSFNDRDMAIILPFAVGAVLGLVAFSYVLSWIFKKYSNQTISLLTGFMLGSLLVVWPWKEPMWQLQSNGEPVINHHGEKIVQSYQYLLPSHFNTETIAAILLIFIGFFVVYVMEKFSPPKST